MKDLLFHVSDEKYAVLDPDNCKTSDNCIFFSKNIFISYFGQFLYIFDYKALEEDFRIHCVNTDGIDYHREQIGRYYKKTEYRYRSQPLGMEYRIYDKIDVERYCLGIAEHYNSEKGEFQIFSDNLIEKFIINGERITKKEA